jgi:HAD superfamily hydrolase (TIGR01490 family)
MSPAASGPPASNPATSSPAIGSLAIKSSAARDSALRIAAFFDLDGTLLPAPSLEWRFAAYLLARDEISDSNLARWLIHCMKGFLRSPWGISRANKGYFAGLRTSLVDEWENSLKSDALAPAGLAMFSACAGRIRWHLAQRHAVVFVSGTLDPLARVAARRLGREAAARIETCATRLESLGGHWTGFLSGDHMCGEAKARAVRALALERRFDLSRSFAYGDEIADVPMLAAVGHPTAVNPSSRLERTARLRGWRVCEWRKLEPSAPVAAPRACGSSAFILSQRPTR